MTRWARVGNSQKHKKLPEDATPWKDFWQNRSTADNVDRNKVKSGRIEKKKQNIKKFDFNVERKISEDLVIKNDSKFRNIKQEESENNLTTSKLSLTNMNEVNKHLHKIESTDSQVLSRKQLRKAKKKAKLQQLKNAPSNNKRDNTSSINLTTDALQADRKLSNEKIGSDILSKKHIKKAKLQQLKKEESNDKQNNTSSNTLTMDVFQTDAKSSNEKLDSQILSKKQSRKAKKKAKFQQLKNEESNEKQENNTSNNTQTTEVIHTDTKSSNEKDFQGKKKLFMKKLHQTKKNGNMILPAKNKRRLYNIKKCLREKGLSPATIKKIVQKERKIEELKCQRFMSTKPCFNCRQIGHLLADCPMPLGDSNQETGICFKCGSPEHTSYKCPEEIKGYPLAKCFVCKEQGHISKDCPKNSHGVYIKGGKCSLCGNVNHLKKDCPTLKSKKDKEVDITVYTINEGKSVDAEIIPEDDVETDRKTYIKREKKAKVIKF